MSGPAASVAATLVVSVEITDVGVGCEREDPGMSTAVGPILRRGSQLAPARIARARAWNRRIHEVVHPDSPGELPFFCECGLSSCRSNVWLTLAEARRAIDSGRMIVGAHCVTELEVGSVSMRELREAYGRL